MHDHHLSIHSFVYSPRDCKYMVCTRQMLSTRKQNRHNVCPQRGFPGGSVVKNLCAMQETQVQTLGPGRSPGEGNGNLLQYSCLGNPRDRGAWHGVTKESDMT